MLIKRNHSLFFVIALSLLAVSMVSKAEYVLTKDPTYGAQSYFEGESFPHAWIKQCSETGKRITAVSFRNARWTVVMSENSGFSQQSYNSGEIMPYAWIDQKLADNYFVTGVVTTGSQVLVVMSRGAPFSHQELPNYNMFTLPTGSDGYRMTAFVMHDASLYSVRSAGSGIIDQVWALRSSFPSDFVSNQWAKGFRITGLQQSGGWYVVMSKTNGTAWSEKYAVAADKLQAAVNDGWKIKLSY
ncbi:hypothetical protein MHB_0003650 [Pseudomonas fluorescens BBc6R8]|uniref:DUF7477 domain-containing protein n=1 Tax=Pseudomonas fluorescens TaxID=294 RepID=UPI000281C8C8|nr:hypothetical protein [Pseudomonas fluorescens]QQD55382.1 hypothetical protein MHB_0003650 [Pseudomonas fluorescens BBc6R8]